MSQHLFTKPPGWPTYLVIAGTLGFCIAFLALSPGHRSVPDTPGAVVGPTAASEDSEPSRAPQQIAGAAARKYLQETDEGKSLMQALTVARFGLKSQERGPFGEAGSGYLGMSHDQNLNAWFGEDGVTVRPTVSEPERERAWHMDLRLKAYGYGNELEAAPPIVSHQVKGNRIEYERTNFGLRNANFEFEALSVFQSAIGNRQSAITEWYENRAEGIEQGFTIATRPERKGAVGTDEPLRLVVSLKGDLRAQVKDEGRAIELTDAAGKRALSYSKLTALDADGKKLAAHMEATADGSEIALVVDDRGASYPIVIDPIVAALEKILDAGGFRQADAQFGNAVAIRGDRAVVGAWREDYDGDLDLGNVYFFSRTGSTWSLVDYSLSHFYQIQARCGYSVAISGDKAAYGCPGANSNTGRAFLYSFSSRTTAELIPPAANRAVGDFFGASVAISGSYVVVGAPRFHSSNGAFHIFSASPPSYNWQETDSKIFSVASNAQYGASVAIDGATIVVGIPGFEAADVYRNINGGWVSLFDLLKASDGQAGDLFGQFVAVSGNTAVISAGGDDDKGTDAGAAYVFVRDANGEWSQQQKLTASDAHAGDLFSYNAVAIEGNTIVAGALFQDAGFSDPNDNRGAAYVFTRNGTTWTEQRRIRVATFDGGGPGNLFGNNVALSGNTVIVGAQHAPASDGTANTGAAYVYRLDCTAPSYGFAPDISIGGQPPSGNSTACSGQVVSLFVLGVANWGNAPLSYQWRRNGVNIGANSAVYTVLNAGASDAGSYDVIVSNACGSEISSAATLSIHTFSINPTSQNFSASGSNGIVNVTSTGSCAWTAVSNSPFITITSGQTGTAPGTVGFTVAGNTGPNQRTGTITIGDKAFTVTQDGLNCSYSIAPTAPNFSAGSNASSVNVTATAGCAWTAISNDAWLTITSGSSGTGNGSVNYTVAANTGPARTGTLAVAGQTVTVTQANGCTYSLSPTAQNFPASIAAGAVNVTTSAGCAWTATSNAAFINVTSGASGTGSGSVGYSLTANDTVTPRTGTITIGGQTFTVTQDGASPTPTPTPTPTSNVVQFSSSNYGVVEDCTTVTITVNRLGDTSGAASVDYSTSDVSASERRDYITALGKLTFAPGETSKSFAVLINEDSYVEGTETFNVNLSNPSGVTLGAPAIATVTITDDASEPATNVIDDPQTFVCQHYHDFLNRAPDAGGLAFWTNEIASCGANQACLELKRINVSAAYFLSIEFQQTGYLVERLYKTSFGNANGASTFGGSHQLPVPIVRLNEFLSDTQNIGQGVVVGQTGWEQVLENNKQAFIASFVQRSRFTSAFPVSLTAAQFVDTLNSNAGNPLSPAERDQLVNNLTSGTMNRAQVLQAVAEDPDLVNGESNRAFVLMQFFGYLRRNPNDPQDTDYTGYDFWLTKLNQFNGNFQNAEMVKAFITSGEYRQRFGP